VIPYHPPAIKLSLAQLDNLIGDYRDPHGRPVVSIYVRGDMLFEKNQQGEVSELAAESPSVFFYLNGSATTRLTFERGPGGHVTALILRDDRHEERWEKRTTTASR
jgi:hypothetical protein